MIVRLKKGIRSYYAAPNTFTEKNPEQKISAKLGKYLLGTGYFKEVEGSDYDTDNTDEEETNEEVEASEQKKLYDESQEEAKKKSTKKDK